eukprot:scaffold78_cov14-Prasinocladus_malaysianus.AAC.1
MDDEAEAKNWNVRGEGRGGEERGTIDGRTLAFSHTVTGIWLDSLQTHPYMKCKIMGTQK